MDFIYAKNIIVLLIYVIYFVPVLPKNIETVFRLFFLDLYTFSKDPVKLKTCG